MRELDEFAALMRDFASLIELPGLEPEAGYLCLAVDNGTMVQILADDDGIGFRIFTELAAIGERHFDQLVLRLLHANLLMVGTCGGALGMNPKDGTVLLTRHESLQSMDPQRLYATLERFLETAFHWKTLLEDTIAELESPHDGFTEHELLRV